jgi:hypothetical protein
VFPENLEPHFQELIVSTIYQQVLEFFEKNDFEFAPDSTKQLVRTAFQSPIGNIHLLAKVDPVFDLVNFCGEIGVAIPDGARHLVAEAVIHANLGFRLGGFDLNLETGQLFFRAATIPIGGEISETAMDMLMAATISSTCRYFPAFLSVVYANENPADAIKRVEAEPLSVMGSEPPSI